METPVYLDRPPTYQQALSKSQEELPNQNIQFDHLRTFPPPAQSQTRIIAFGDAPVTVNCPACHSLVITNVDEENGAFIFFLCILIILFGGILGCCLIPFCISSLKDKIHYCPRCHKAIGKKSIL